MARAPFATFLLVAPLVAVGCRPPLQSGEITVLPGAEARLGMFCRYRRLVGAAGELCAEPPASEPAAAEADAEDDEGADAGVEPEPTELEASVAGARADAGAP